MVWLRWVTNDIAEFKTANLSAHIGLPEVISRLMKSRASVIKGGWGILDIPGSDGGECVCCSEHWTPWGVVVAFTPPLRFDTLRPARAVRKHCILESTEFPHGSSLSHFTWSMDQKIALMKLNSALTFLTRQVSHCSLSARSQRRRLRGTHNYEWRHGVKASQSSRSFAVLTTAISRLRSPRVAGRYVRKPCVSANGREHRVGCRRKAAEKLFCFASASSAGVRTTMNYVLPGAH